MAEESAMSSAESGVSGMSSVGGADPAAPVPGGAGAAQAEMITKKLANYWCIIGSIPLVMFLLVALPTIFYVKKFSEYVNADYCDTKSCKELADLIQKMGDTSDACKGFSAHVCKAKTDYFAKTAEKIFTEMSNANVDTTKLKGVTKASDVVNLLTNIAAVGGDPPDAVDLALPGGAGKGMDSQGALDPAYLAGAMATRGIDGFVRAVLVTGNVSGNQGSDSILELSAPIEDMYPYIILDMAGIDLKAAVIQMLQEADVDPPEKLGAFITSFNALVITNTLNSRQHMSKLMTVEELTKLPADEWSWTQFFQPFEEMQVDYVSQTSFVRLSHPKYLFALDKFLADWKKKDMNYRVVANGMMQAIARLSVLGHLCIAKFAGNKKLASVMLAARVYPAGMDHVLFYVRNKQFGAANGVNPGGTNDTMMIKFLSQEVQGMLDSMTFSYALSQNATEENRVHFYRRVKHMKVSPGFFNDSAGLSDTDMADWASGIQSSADSGPDPFAAPIQSRFNFPIVYWKKNMTFLKFRNPYNPLYATYTPTEDHLFVPMGVFTPPVFRNSQKNRIFAATSGYLVMAGVMKALTMSGAMVVPNQQMGENWVGYSWSRKMEKYALCLSTDRKDNSSIMAAMDIPLLAAVIPAYRYFKRMVLEKAFPRPEFRIDWISDISSTQLFFYKWAMLHCGTTMGKEIIDLSAKNSRYFHEAFNCEPTSKMYKRNTCDLWNTTRRDY